MSTSRVLLAILSIVIWAGACGETPRARPPEDGGGAEVLRWVPDPERPGCVCHHKDPTRCRCSEPQVDAGPPDDPPADDATVVTDAGTTDLVAADPGVCGSSGDSCHTEPPGGSDYCTVDCPCGWGEGDCDGDATCQPGLVCVDDVGADFGEASTKDYCLLPGYPAGQQQCAPPSTDGAPAADASAPDSAPEPDSGPSCGDGTCSGAESCTSCPADCSCPPVACSYYVAPQGTSSASGKDPSSPLSLDAVRTMTQPGDTVCLLAGTYYRDKPFYPGNSGAPGKYITYTSYGGEAKLVWTGASSGNDVNTIHFWKGPNYVEIRNLVIDASNTSPTNIKCHEAHHLRLIGNTLLNGGAAGIATKYCDYVTAIGNRVHHFGYVQGWSSGISLNSHQWTDSYPGLHSVVFGNIISGGFDASSYKTDGNGIILDLSANSYDPSTADTPPALVASNVVYQNGGRCINAFVVTNAWIVNNTCYKNAVDPAIGPGEITINKSKDSYVINNVVYGKGGGSCYAEWNASNVHYASNAYHNCGNDLPSAVEADPAQLVGLDPQFVDPVYVDLSAPKPWELALSPTKIVDQFKLAPTSPAIDLGTAAESWPNLPAELAADLKQALATDIDGIGRPLGTAVDLGAYEIK